MENNKECATVERTAWQVGKPFNQRMAHLLNSKLMSDVCFVVSDTENSTDKWSENLSDFPDDDVLMIQNHKFFGHKLILAASSPVFQKMFEKTIGQQEQVEINDIEPGAFFVMLKFAYCNEIDLNDKCLLSTLHAANAYIYPELLDGVAKRLMTTLNPENALQFFEQLNPENALAYEAKPVNDQLSLFIQSTALKLISAPSFLDIKQSTLDYLLSQPYLHIPEPTLLVRCLDWARAQCIRQELDANSSENLKLVLHDSIYKIRIEDCDFRLLLQLIDQPFTKEETLDIVTYLQLSGKPRKGVMEKFCYGGRRPWTYSYFQIPLPKAKTAAKTSPRLSWIELEFDVVRLLIFEFQQTGKCSLNENCDEWTLSTGTKVLTACKQPKFTLTSNETYKFTLTHLMFKPNQKYRITFKWNCNCELINESVNLTEMEQKSVPRQVNRRANMSFTHRNFPQCIRRISLMV